MELCGFANAIDQHFVSYGCACMGMVVTEAITWLLKKGIFV